MDDLQAKLNDINDGAHFFRADLHIHSHGSDGSHDVADTLNTPKAIVDTAIAQGLKVISITDHKKTGNSKTAIEYALDKDILVIPGVELTTSQGHLLLYAPNVQDLDTVIARLTFSGDMCTNTIAQCLDAIVEFKGFGIAAHIDKSSGFELKISGYGEEKTNLFCHSSLLGIEINNSTNLGWYTSADEQTQRKELIEKRRDALTQSTDYNIAHVTFSDAHQLNRVGKNAVGDVCATRIKMDELTFDSLRTAFNDPSARIRSEELVPKTIPKFIGMEVTGGFLDGQKISFNSNLTCIIGGRGTGKSTLLESLRTTSGNSSDNNLIDSEVWPETIKLIYEDETGLRHMLVREKGARVYNDTDPLDGLDQVLIESYGQGDTAQTIKNSDKDPGVLLKFLDDFVDVGEEQALEEKYRDELLENQTAIEKLEIEVAQLPDTRRRFANANLQLTQLKANNAEELITHEQALVAEKVIRESVMQNLEDFELQVSESLTDKESLSNIESLEIDGLIAGKTELTEIQKLIKTLGTALDAGSTEIKKATEPIITLLNEQIETWKLNESKLQSKITAIREGLEKKGIQLDYTFIKKVVEDASTYSLKIKDLTAKTVELRQLKTARTEIIRNRKINQTLISSKRISFARKLNDIFKETVDDYLIKIKYKDGLHSPELRQILLETTGWRTNQQARADAIANNINVNDLIEMVKTGDSTALEALKFDNDEKVFTRTDARDILAKLKEPSVHYRLERSKYDDRPSITVSKEITLPDDTKKTLVRDFGKLSLGQQQSVILTILLFSESTVPLIIDQPEDDLDSEFIYKTLVKNLRRVKERRQVILVTHNANIAVLGDAELILPLRASSDKSIIKDRGSIDNVATKEITCTILEGSKEAFLKRKTLYGIS